MTKNKTIELKEHHITTAELIDLLKQLDPKGTAVVCCSCNNDILLPISITSELKQPDCVLFWQPKVWIDLKQYVR